MHLPTHALASWLLAESGPRSMVRRDRALILAAGLFPDLDALTLLGGVEAYQRWHHVILHNLLAAALCSLLLAALARARVAVLLLSLVAYHLHLVCDYLGSAGPDGSVWPIPYLMPFSSHEFAWAGQWGLASWQNVSITVALLLASWALAVRRGRTLLEAVSLRADAAVTAVLRRRWPL
jgi:inner membrane protein